MCRPAEVSILVPRYECEVDEAYLEEVEVAQGTRVFVCTAQPNQYDAYQ